MQISLDELASLVNGKVIGDPSLKVTGLSPINEIREGTLVYADSIEKLKIAEDSKAGALLVREGVDSLKSMIQVIEPFDAFIRLIQFFYPPKEVVPGIHPTAVIAPDVAIGKAVYIGPHVVIESGSRLGDGVVIKSHVYVGHSVSIADYSVIHPHVTVYDRCHLGSNVIVHASSVIGSDGFGYVFKDGRHVKTPHVGTVVIEDDVEIGANSVIDRATLGSTVIGKGTKIDNLVQVAHSVKIGRHNILCAFTGIAGSSSSGDHVTFAAGVGVSDHVKIEDGVILGARSGVPPKKVLRKGLVYLGNPARPRDKAMESEFSVVRIPSMRKHLQALTQRVTELTSQLEALTQKTEAQEKSNE